MHLTNDKLPDNPEELKAIILSKDEVISSKDEHITILQEQIRVLKKAIFGNKSEKRRLDETEGGAQLHLFNEAEALVEEKKEKAPVTVPEHTRQRPRRKPLPENLPRIEVIEDIEESEKLCACGAQLSRI
jgi:transposase